MRFKPRNGDNAFFEVMLDGKLYTVKMLRELGINPLRLDVELGEHPGRYSYYLVQLNKTEDELDKLQAKLTKDVLLELKRKGLRVTNAIVDSLIRQSTKWRRLSTQRGNLQALVKGLEEKGKILANQCSILKRERFQSRG